MHELSIVQNIVETTDAFAREHGVEKVSYVALKIGAAPGIEERYVWMYFPDVAEGTALEGAEVRIEEVPEEAFCLDCGNVFNPRKSSDKCPECGCSVYDLLHGNELMIREIGYN